MTNLLSKITTIIGATLKVVAVVSRVLDIVVEAGAKIVTLTPTDKDDKVIEWIKKHNVAGYIDKFAEILKNFKGYLN